MIEILGLVEKHSDQLHDQQREIIVYVSYDPEVINETFGQDFSSLLDQ